MLRLIGIELFKIRKRWMPWILLAVLFAVLCLAFWGTYAFVVGDSAGMPAEELEAESALIQFPHAFTNIFDIVYGIGTILVIILVASMVGNEYRWGTVGQMLTRRGGRFHYLGAKLLALIIVALIGLVFALTVGVILTSITDSLLAGGINWDFISASFVWEVVLMFGRTTFILLPYILLAAMLAIVGRSALAGIAGGLVVNFVDGIASEILSQVSGWAGSIPDYLMSHNISAIMSLNRLSGDAYGNGAGIFGMTAMNLPGTLHATVTLVIYCLAFLAISFYLFRKQDLTVQAR
jgi:ABC-2 type transport system permease protein